MRETMAKTALLRPRVLWTTAGVAVGPAQFEVDALDAWPEGESLLPIALGVVDQDEADAGAVHVVGPGLPQWVRR
jgi:hypothetical protein